MRHSPTTFMKKTNPNFDHNLSEKPLAVNTAKTANTQKMPRILGNTKSGQPHSNSHSLGYKTQNKVIQKGN